MVTTKLITALPNASLNEYGDDGFDPCWGPVRNAVCRAASGILWVAYNNSTTLFIRKSEDNGDTWSLDASVTLPTSATLHTQIVLDSDGEPWIFCSTSSAIHYTRRTGAGTYASFVQIATGINGLASENKWISACVDPNKRFHVIVSDGGGSTAVNGRYITDVSGSITSTIVWTDATSGSATDSFHATITVDSLGFLHLFYRYRITSGDPTQNFKYRYTKIAAGASFPELNHLAPGYTGAGIESVRQNTEVSDSSLGGQMCISLDDGNGPHLSWSEVVTGGGHVTARNIYYAFKSAGAWIVELADSDLTKFRMNPSVSVPKSGVIHITFSETDTGGGGVDHRIKLAKRTAGSWVTATLISGSGQAYNRPRLLHHNFPSSGVKGGIAKAGALGVFIDFNASNNADYYLFVTDDWEENDGSELTDEAAPAYPAATNFASIALTGEGYPTLIYPMKYDLVLPYTDRFFTESEITDSGWEVRWPRVSRNRRQWVVRQSALTQSERDQIESFLDSVSGPLTTFWLTMVDPAEGVKVKMAQDAAPFVKMGEGVYSVYFLVDEVLT